ITVSVLSFLGAIGYIVMVDVWLILKGKREALTFTSRIILLTTFILFSLGFALIYLDGFLKNGHREGDFLTALFQSMTALTTVGFNTVPIGGLKSFSLFVLLILMIIGASPSGTGGGIKSTTVSGIIGVLKSVFSFRKEYINYHLPVRNSESEKATGKKDKPLLQGLTKLWHFKKKTVAIPEIELSEEEPDSELEKILGDIFKIKLAGRTIPFDRVIHAIATFSFYFIILFAGILLLLLSEPFGFEQTFFEAASALGTVGLSTGITGDLSEPGKFIVILLMLIGRLGPITFGVFLFSRRPKPRPANEMEDLVV
ncbi:MAG: TrkH family potassium uptake protein, partial [Spirochaetales bacterium]|nr:TrkH family potassium uptake protein [Spirochaetales bacterium]